MSITTVILIIAGALAVIAAISLLALFGKLVKLVILTGKGLYYVLLYIALVAASPVWVLIKLIKRGKSGGGNS